MFLFLHGHGAAKAVSGNGNEYGLFGGGMTKTNYTDKYTYANNTVIAGAALGLNRYNLAACSSSPGGF